MRVFERLRALRAFEKQHLHFLNWGGDHRLIGEIGHHQAQGKPLTLKQLFVLDLGSIATVQRSLRRFKLLGLVQHRRAAHDRRAVELTLSPKFLRIFTAYGDLMTSNASPRIAERASGAPGHICGLCDSDASCRKLLVDFLVQGLKRGDKCVLVAPAAEHREILAQLNDRRKAPRQLVVTEGYESVEAQFAFFKRVLEEAKRAGQAMCLAANMAWTQSKNLPMDAVLEIEKRFDTLARRLPLTGLCVYDARRFSSGDFLQAVKCHRGHSRHPIALA